MMIGAPGFTEGLPGYVAMFFGANARFQISVTPLEGPIVVPPEGGSFRYELEVVNQTNSARTLDLWVVLTGEGVDRSLVRFRESFPPGELRRTLTKRIPANLAAGSYVITGNLGKFPTARPTASFETRKE